MREFEVTVTAPGGERWTHSIWNTLAEAEAQAKFLRSSMPGAIIRVNDWSDIEGDSENIKKLGD